MTRSRELERHAARLRAEAPLPSRRLRPWVARALWLVWGLLVALLALAACFTVRGF